MIVFVIETMETAYANDDGCKHSLSTDIKRKRYENVATSKQTMVYEE